MADGKSAKRDGKPDILFISGSPRNGSCVALIDLIERGARQAGAKTQRFLLSKKHIAPCVGCGSCNKTGSCVLATKTRAGRFTDDYLELKATLERVDALAIVAPLYFAGPPAQLKALYDRMQPYWAQRYLLGLETPEKRPAHLFVVGGGGDAHGHAPLVGSTKSALAVAGFNLEKVNNFIGFIRPKELPSFPREDELADYSHAQLAHLRRLIAAQEAFTQRALDAGGAFARFIVKKKQAGELAAQLASVQAELELLRHVGDGEKPESAPPASASAPSVGAGAGRVGLPNDAKADLRAEIDLEYRNLISRTPRVIAEADAGEQDGDASAGVDAGAGVDADAAPVASADAGAGAGADA
ncbi:MAG: flavodoxin family protein, partial [Coriobacteriales bacterium]|nr:flavodoxin family protein [Coriobacteriales bacterium]